MWADARRATVLFRLTWRRSRREYMPGICAGVTFGSVARFLRRSSTADQAADRVAHDLRIGVDRDALESIQYSKRLSASCRRRHRGVDLVCTICQREKEMIRWPDTLNGPSDRHTGANRDLARLGERRCDRWWARPEAAAPAMTLRRPKRTFASMIGSLVIPALPPVRKRGKTSNLRRAKKAYGGSLAASVAHLP